MVEEYSRRRGVMLAVGHSLAGVIKALWSEVDCRQLHQVQFVAVVPPDVAALGIPVHWAYRETLRRKYRAWASTSRPGPAKYTNAEPPKWLGDVPVVRA
jgi:hypothetical protein